jgi:hypothetical protein
MAHHANIRLNARGSSPQLPAFCRSRRTITTNVRVSSLQQLQWLLWLLLALQLSTILLLLASPLSAPQRPQAGAAFAATGESPLGGFAHKAIASRTGAAAPTVPSPSQP